MRALLPLLALPIAAVCLFPQDSTRRVAPAAPARRLALVIGNQNYSRIPLRNPRADADAMESLLRGDLSFTDVQKVEDGKLLDMQRAIREFVRRVRPGDLALFYYSGHGMQANGVNWMIPVDFRADFEDEVPDQAYPAQRVLQDLEDAGAGVRILILDACRDNPLPAAGRRSNKRGLAAMNGAEGTYVLFATAENQTADDNPRGTNGLFTSYLLEAMRRPGVSLDAAFKETRRLVGEASGGRQRPWMQTDIDYDVILRPGGSNSSAIDLDLERYNAVKDSHDPAQLEEAAGKMKRPDLADLLRERARAIRSASAVPRESPSPAGVTHRAEETRQNAKDGLTYVWIPPGTFEMGCSPGDSECLDSEKPAHQVTITKGFWLGQTPVTQEAYQRVTGKTPSYFKGSGKLPVEQVNWDEARAYCQAVDGRLPTEAEWEYAASGGTTGARYGDPDQIAWYDKNSGGKTHEVGQKQANAFGLYDMLGNVLQWVADWYGDYSAGAQSDPSGPASGRNRSLRGGSWNGYARFARVSYRGWGVPEFRFSIVGLRCAGN